MPAPDESYAHIGTHDTDGNLIPLMLSELIALAQRALEEHGDMPVSVCTEHFDDEDDADDIECKGGPVLHAPIINTDTEFLQWECGDKFTKSFHLASFIG